MNDAEITDIYIPGIYFIYICCVRPNARSQSHFTSTQRHLPLDDRRGTGRRFGQSAASVASTAPGNRAGNMSAPLGGVGGNGNEGATAAAAAARTASAASAAGSMPVRGAFEGGMREAGSGDTRQGLYREGHGLLKNKAQPPPPLALLDQIHDGDQVGEKQTFFFLFLFLFCEQHEILIQRRNTRTWYREVGSKWNVGVCPFLSPTLFRALFSTPSLLKKSVWRMSTMIVAGTMYSL